MHPQGYFSDWIHVLQLLVLSAHSMSQSSKSLEDIFPTEKQRPNLAEFEIICLIFFQFNSNFYFSVPYDLI